jgi:hypothetical protein
VSKKSCTVKIHGFHRKFADSSKQLQELAACANASHEAGARFFAELSTLQKTFGLAFTFV